MAIRTITQEYGELSPAVYLQLAFPRRVSAIAGLVMYEGDLHDAEWMTAQESRRANMRREEWGKERNQRVLDHAR